MGKDYNFACIDRSKMRDQGRYCISSQNRNIYIERIPERDPF